MDKKTKDSVEKIPCQNGIFSKKKILMCSVVIINIVNFLLVAGFIVYLYFWVKARS